MKRDYLKKTIALSEEEGDILKEFIRKGNNLAMIIRRAKVILAADINGKKLQDQVILKLFGVSNNMQKSIDANTIREQTIFRRLSHRGSFSL